MSIKKKIVTIAISMICVLAIGFLTLISPWLLLAVGLCFLPAPPKPEIRYGEFDFKLVYEINGEMRTVEDTIVCKFDGFHMDEGQGKTRRWKEEFKNEQKNDLYAFRVENPEYNEYRNREPDYNQIVLQNIDHYKVVLRVADAEYFLGEPENKRTTPLEPSIQVYDKSTGYYKDPQQSDEFLNNYDFKVMPSKSCLRLLCLKRTHAPKTSLSIKRK